MAEEVSEARFSCRCLSSLIRRRQRYALHLKPRDRGMRKSRRRLSTIDERQHPTSIGSSCLKPIGANSYYGTPSGWLQELFSDRLQWGGILIYNQRDLMPRSSAPKFLFVDLLVYAKKRSKDGGLEASKKEDRSFAYAGGCAIS